MRTKRPFILLLIFLFPLLIWADAPFNLRARFVSTNIELAWSNGTYTNISQLRIYKRTQYSEFAILTNLSPASTLFLDEDVHPFTYYKYKVVTVNSSNTERHSTSEIEISSIKNGYTDLIRFENNTASPGGNIRFWYSVPEKSEVTISILNSVQDVLASFPQGTQEAGTYPFTWQLQNLQGETLQSGIYILVLKAGFARDARKVVVKP